MYIIHFRFFILYLILAVFPFCKAFAFCIEPSVPDMASLSMMKPSVLICLSNYKFSGGHECSQWELDSYINDVNAYIQRLNQYVRDSINFANEAQAYAKCLSDEVKNELS